MNIVTGRFGLNSIRATAIASALFALVAPLASAQSTWDGGGTNNDLSNATNWVGDVAPNFSGAEFGSTNNLLFNNALNTTVNMGASTRRGVSNATFVGPNVGAFNFTNTGRWILSYGGKISMDSQATNTILIGRIGFGTNAGGGSYTLENNAALSSAIISNISFTAANTNTSTVFLDGSNTGANRFDGASGNVALVKNGSGRWELSSVTTSGGFTLNSGTVGLRGDNAMGTGSVTINGGIVGSVASSRLVSNSIAIAASFQLGGLGQSTAFSGNWDLGGGNRTITMGNSATMSGIITNGNLTIKDGALNLVGTGLIAINTIFNLDGTNSLATLNIGAITASTLTVDNFSASTNTAISLTNKSLTIGGDNSSTTVRSAITGTGGSLIKNGSGTLTLGSSSSTYSGGTSLNGGAIAFVSANSFGTGAVNVAAGTQLGAVSGGPTISNTVNVNGDFILGGFGSGATFSGTWNLGAQSRTITLGNSATMSGTITNGSLVIRDGALNLTGSGLVAANTKFTLDGTNSAASLNISNITASVLTVDNFSATTNTLVILGSKSLTIGSDNSSTTLRAAISGTGGLIKNGTGTVTLGPSGSPSSTFSGGTSLNAGTIAISSSSAFGTGQLSISNGTVLGSVVSARTLPNSVLVGGSFTLGVGDERTTFNGAIDLGGAQRAITLVNSAVFVGAVTNGGLTIRTNADSAAGVALTLAGFNSLNGTTTVESGALIVTNSTLVATITSTGVALNFATNSPAVGTYNVLSSPLNVASLASVTVTASGGSLPAGLTATLANGPNLQVTVASSSNYDSWASGYGLNPATTGAPTADPDNDGFNNNSEYAFGTSPIAANGALLSTSVSGSQLTVSWIQRNTDLIYAVQSTANLADSFVDDGSVNVTISESQSGVPSGYTRRQFTVTATGVKFYRIKATP